MKKYLLLFWVLFSASSFAQESGDDGYVYEAGDTCFGYAVDGVFKTREAYCKAVFDKAKRYTYGGICNFIERRENADAGVRRVSNRCERNGAMRTRRDKGGVPFDRYGAIVL